MVGRLLKDGEASGRPLEDHLVECDQKRSDVAADALAKFLSQDLLACLPGTTHRRRQGGVLNLPRQAGSLGFARTTRFGFKHPASLDDIAYRRGRALICPSDAGYRLSALVAGENSWPFAMGNFSFFAGAAHLRTFLRFKLRTPNESDLRLVFSRSSGRLVIAWRRVLFCNTWV